MLNKSVLLVHPVIFLVSVLVFPVCRKQRKGKEKNELQPRTVDKARWTRCPIDTWCLVLASGIDWLIDWAGILAGVGLCLCESGFQVWQRGAFQFSDSLWGSCWWGFVGTHLMRQTRAHVQKLEPKTTGICLERVNCGGDRPLKQNSWTTWMFFLSQHNYYKMNWGKTTVLTKWRSKGVIIIITKQPTVLFLFL